MKLFDKYGTWACVVGAAEGLGSAFSVGLAQRGFNLILIDKQEDKLNDLKIQLENKFSIETQQVRIDLNDKACIEQIMNVLGRQNCRFMIYNASYGPVKPFLTNTPDELDLCINVNISAPLHLSHGFAQLNRNNQAGILLLSSLAGFRGTRMVIPYAAAKAFTWNLAEGLFYEFKDTLMDFSVCCPGPTDTPNYRSTQPRKTFITPKSMKPELVAEEALNNFGKKLFIIPGLGNKIAHFILNRVLPRKISSTIHNAAMKKMYG